MKLGLSPSLSRGFYEARRDLGDPPAWVVYSGAERYPIAEGVEALGLDELCETVLPKLRP